jgi:hypothetical protein
VRAALRLVRHPPAYYSANVDAVKLPRFAQEIGDFAQKHVTSVTTGSAKSCVDVVDLGWCCATPRITYGARDMTT